MAVTDPKITIKVTVPFKSFEDAQKVAGEVTKAVRELASAPSKRAKVVFVKVEE